MRRLSVFLISICCACFGVLITHKIILTNTDLARHIQNGNVILNGTKEQAQAVLHANFYSYTFPDFPFINHHWGIGVLFYKTWAWFGFSGLSILYIAVGVAAFSVCLGLAILEGSLVSALLSALLLLSMLSNRTEIRPEMFSYLLALLFFAALYIYKKKYIIFNKNWLFLLVPLQILWVNIHIGFFLGEVIVGLFLLSELFAKQRVWKEVKFFSFLLLSVAAATLVNPSFIHGALYPLFIFSNYGYPVFENQSVFKLEELGQSSFVFSAFKTALFSIWFLCGVYVIKTKRWSFLLEPLTLITIFSSVLALEAYRSLIIFAFFAVPFLSGIMTKLSLSFSRFISARWVSVFLTSLFIVCAFNAVKTEGQVWGIGLAGQQERSVQFFKDAHLTGPIYNDYDIGSFLDFELYGKEKIYTDNRPEAYPATFFTDAYINGQYSDEVWNKEDVKYHFNTIWFDPHDLTPWGNAFLSRRAKDPAWVVVYYDDFSVIFAKRATMH